MQRSLQNLEKLNISSTEISPKKPSLSSYTRILDFTQSFPLSDGDPNSLIRLILSISFLLSKDSREIIDSQDGGIVLAERLVLDVGKDIVRVLHSS